MGRLIWLCCLASGCIFNVQPLDVLNDDMNAGDDMSVAADMTMPPPDFVGLDLTGVDLSFPDLSRPDLSFPDLSFPDLSQPDMAGSCTTSAMCGAPAGFCVSGACNPITSGLIGYWKLDEATLTNDCTSARQLNSVTAIADGVTCDTPTVVAGKYGNAVRFDTTDNDRVQIPPGNSYTFGTGNFSVCFWANMASLLGDQTAIDFLRDMDDRIWIEHSATTGWNFAVQIAAGGIDVAPVLSQGAVTMTTATWNHVCLVRNGNAWNIYLNGASVANNPNSAINLSTNNGVTVGYGQDSDQEFNGAIDEVRIYSRALTPAEILGLSLPN